MITVSEARAILFGLISPLPAEPVPLADAAGRVLASDAVATRDQPPFAASTMDGYALKGSEVERHAMFKVIGEAAAGGQFDGTVRAGQAARIFTGAPLPKGADFVVMQEDTSQSGDLITLIRDPGQRRNTRPAGADFRAGSTIPAPRILRAEDVALLASMNIPRVSVTRRPVVALIATGNELVMPGEQPGADQIIASNIFGLKALLETAGARVRTLPIGRDTVSSLQTVFGLAHGADLIITIGGASVGDYDLVAPVAAQMGMEITSYKVLMRPGKPLVAGRLGDAAMVGLPGNPVSAMVGGYVLILPMIRAMLGLGTDMPPLPRAPLAADIGANGASEHYMRARLVDGELSVFDKQDASLLTVLSQSNALVVRAPRDAGRKAGEIVAYMPI